jgi:hypothetical protein
MPTKRHTPESNEVQNGDAGWGTPWNGWRRSSTPVHGTKPILISPDSVGLEQGARLERPSANCATLQTKAAVCY